MPRPGDYHAGDYHAGDYHPPGPAAHSPHDFVVEGNFSETFADDGTGTGFGTTDPKVHGYLPFGIAWCKGRPIPPALTRPR